VNEPNSGFADDPTKREVSRFVDDPTGVTDLLALFTFVNTMPREWALLTDALWVLPGQGEVERTRHAIRTWESPQCTAIQLTLAGSYRGERTWEQPTMEQLVKPPFHLERTRNVHLLADVQNTAEQATQMLDHAAMHSLNSIALHAPAYHLPRAFMTFLQALIRHDMAAHFDIVPVSVDMPPHKISPETGQTSRQLLVGELERIVKYQEKGDVATNDATWSYIERLWEQPLFVA
jgi:hypothetical protein